MSFFRRYEFMIIIIIFSVKTYGCGGKKKERKEKEGERRNTEKEYEIWFFN